MQHNVNINDISDGKLYNQNDLIRIGCDGCSGTASCCRFAEDTITLDPYDIYQLMLCIGLSFEALYKKQIVALSPVDGLLLPHLQFTSDTKSCPFLAESGRCSIHAHRPGLCRLFPLARMYQEDTVSYLIQTHECPCKTTPKTKIKNWLEIPDINRYETYLLRWNALIQSTKQRIAKVGEHAELSKLTTAVLKTFYFTPYDTTQTFYEQFEGRLNAIRCILLIH